jgi:hypothetical protein
MRLFGGKKQKKTLEEEAADVLRDSGIEICENNPRGSYIEMEVIGVGYSREDALQHLRDNAIKYQVAFVSGLLESPTRLGPSTPGKKIVSKGYVPKTDSVA